MMATNTWFWVSEGKPWAWVSTLNGKMRGTHQLSNSGCRKLAMFGIEKSLSLATWRLLEAKDLETTHGLTEHRSGIYGAITLTSSCAKIMFSRDDIYAVSPWHFPTSDDRENLWFFVGDLGKFAMNEFCERFRLRSRVLLMKMFFLGHSGLVYDI